MAAEYIVPVAVISVTLISSEVYLSKSPDYCLYLFQLLLIHHRQPNIANSVSVREGLVSIEMAYELGEF